MHQIFNQRSNFILKKAPGGPEGNWTNITFYCHPCLNSLYPSLLPYFKLHLQWGVFVFTVQQLWVLQTKRDTQDGYLKEEKSSPQKVLIPEDQTCVVPRAKVHIGCSWMLHMNGISALALLDFLLVLSDWIGVQSEIQLNAKSFWMEYDFFSSELT